MHDEHGGDQMRTYKSTNLRGLRASTGSRKKQMTKQAAAPRLQAAKTNNLSQRLTAGQKTLATTSHKLVCRICITCRIDSGHSVHGPLQGLMRRGGRDVMGKKGSKASIRKSDRHGKAKNDVHFVKEPWPKDGVKKVALG